MNNRDTPYYAYWMTYRVMKTGTYCVVSMWLRCCSTFINKDMFCHESSFRTTCNRFSPSPDLHYQVQLQSAVKRALFVFNFVSLMLLTPSASEYSFLCKKGHLNINIWTKIWCIYAQNVKEQNQVNLALIVHMHTVQDERHYSEMNTIMDQ